MLPPDLALLQWYPFKARPSIDLLMAYVRDVERQISTSIEDYRYNYEEEEVDDYSNPDEPDARRIVRHHQGLDDESWDLEDIFADYFPNLQRASAVITLFAFFEHQLEELCNLIQTVKHYKAGVRDMHGTGIDRAVSYLELVCDIDTARESKERQEVRTIQIIRGVLAHGGRADLESNTKLKNAIGASPDLSYEGEIKVGKGYPAHVIGAFSQYFEIVHKGVQSKYAPKPAVAPKV